jgi:two-component system, cell cycle sensor histidine kinase and response regulator CckA
LSLSVKQAGQEATSRVLVVDDEESVRTFTARALAGAGYEVTQAVDGPEALQIAQQQAPFDLCVVDLVMPMMNGDEVARLLRCADPDVKVLYFTGHSDQLFKQTTFLSANEAFLDKPVSIEGLLEAVSLLLFGHIRQ